MRLFLPACTAFVVVANLVGSVSAFAATPFDIAFATLPLDVESDLYPGPIGEAESDHSSEHELRAGLVTLEDVIGAVGKIPTPQLRREVSYFLTHIHGDN
jgi:hypothetical protein